MQLRTRPSSRLLVLDPRDRILLFHFVFEGGALKGQTYWATPGGALEHGEDFRAAAKRELQEETGIVSNIGEPVFQRTAEVQLPTGELVSAEEQYFLVRVSDDTVDESGQQAWEAQFMKTYRWWSADELNLTTETVFPENLAKRMGQWIDW